MSRRVRRRGLLRDRLDSALVLACVSQRTSSTFTLRSASSLKVFCSSSIAKPGEVEPTKPLLGKVFRSSSSIRLSSAACAKASATSSTTASSPSSLTNCSDSELTLVRPPPQSFPKSSFGLPRPTRALAIPVDIRIIGDRCRSSVCGNEGEPRLPRYTAEPVLELDPEGGSS